MRRGNVVVLGLACSAMFLSGPMAAPAAPGVTAPEPDRRAAAAERERVVTTPERDARTGSQAAELSDLVWIAGHWMGEAFGGWIEEAWLGPAGRSMAGVFRLVRDDVAGMYELLLLEQDEDGEIYYRFKHVGRGWEPWEETRLEYRLTELDGRKATFRSTAESPPEHAPWWFTYESPADDELRVSIHGAAGGEPIVLAMTRR